MKQLVKYLQEDFNEDWDYVIEMASIGYPILNKTNHYIALHGTNAGDRERPHIHIYLANDKRPFDKFNFEIALDEILCYDEINLLTMRDKSRHVKLKNRNKCSWDGYVSLKKDFEDFYNNVDPIVTKLVELADVADVIMYINREETLGNRDEDILQIRAECNERYIRL